MSEPTPNPRSPREIAKQASEETDRDKIAELAEELIRALDHETMKRMEQAKTLKKEAA